jgi:hypothetical protein
LFLSIAGILVLAAILGLPLRVHRRQDFPGPAPGQPIDPNGSQSRQETGTSPSQTGTFNSLQGKAEENRTPERYAHPSDNNVIPNSNPALKVDPQDKKASELKVRNAVAQAKDLALAGKSVDARKAFSSLLERARHEDSFPLSPQVLEEEIKKLEVVSYPVIHDHFLGSCKGILQFNSYTITYEPSGEGHHRFNSSLAEIRLGEPSSKLKIFVGRRTYQFKSGSGTSIEDKRQKLRTIYQAITSRSKGNPE